MTAPVAVLALALSLLAAAPAHAGCGHVRRAPAGGVAGVAPLAIGDSVMLGAGWKLSRQGFEVDAKCGRSPGGGLSVLRNRRRLGTLPEVVVVALGTNVFMSRRGIARMLRALGAGRSLMLVTPYRSFRPVGNAAPRAAARRWPRWVTLIDWSAHARGNRHWFWGDGTHLRDSGERAYSRLLRAAAWSRLRGRFVWSDAS